MTLSELLEKDSFTTEEFVLCWEHEYEESLSYKEANDALTKEFIMYRKENDNNYIWVKK